ncbi:ATP-binding protein [Nocardia sp. NPDC049737]|uniref:AAA family ATPase n=1 Tax=Nocardia sp. NPDC049737 TaxID=3154358 RepID=UPI003435B9C3
MAASGFVGRNTELGLLRTRLKRVAESRRGVAVAIRGRRQVGKSRLVQEFRDAEQVPYLHFTATKGMPVSESLATFLAELKRSGIAANPEPLPETIGGWPDAFRLLATTLGDTPTTVVIDELPWLAEQDTVFEGALQTAWDRLLQQRPVLLLLLGCDIHMMEPSPPTTARSTGEQTTSSSIRSTRPKSVVLSASTPLRALTRI